MPHTSTTVLYPRRLHIAPSSARTGDMARTNKKLTVAVEAYFTELGRLHASGGATGERSSYGPLHALLSAVGAALKPKVHCVLEPADQGAGHPDFALYAARQVQKGWRRKTSTCSTRAAAPGPTWRRCCGGSPPISGRRGRGLSRGHARMVAHGLRQVRPRRFCACRRGSPCW